jgi:guanylate kinase
MSANKNTFVVITGPSGFSKSTILKEIISRNPDYMKTISYTDRPKTDDKTDGVDFKFISEAEFTKMIQREEFLEWQRVLSNGHRYGKTKKDVEDVLNNNDGKVIFTVVNIINLPVFKRHYPNAISIFVDVKDSAAVVDYLKHSTEVTSEEEFERRLKYATEERRRRHLADFIINLKDTTEETIEDIQKIIEKVRR